jgi:hypothetical protein
VLSFEHGQPRKVSSIAVDFTERSGAGAVVVFANPWFTPEDRTRQNWHSLLPRKRRDGKAALSFQDLQVGGVPMYFMILDREEAPQAVVKGNAIQLGAQTFRFDGTKLVLGK